MKLKKKIISKDDFEDDRLFVFTTPSGYKETGMTWYDSNKIQTRCKNLFGGTKRKASNDDDDDDDDNNTNANASKTQRTCFIEEDTDDEEPPPAKRPRLMDQDALRAIQKRFASAHRASDEAEFSTAVESMSNSQNSLFVPEMHRETVIAEEPEVET